MRRILIDQRGFTLAELLVVTAVLGLILSAVLIVQQQGQSAYLMGSNRVETQQNARVALDLMTRELRQATAVTALGGASDVSFTIDHDNNVATAPVTVRYQLSGTTLNRTEAGTTTALVGGVTNLTMTYCLVWNATANTCGTPATTPAQVRVIQVEIRTLTEEGVSAGSSYQQARMQSLVRLRNQ